MTSRSVHPSAERLRKFGLGQLEPEVSQLIEAHISTCDVCCRQLNDIPDDVMLAKLKRGRSVGATELVDVIPIAKDNAEIDIPNAFLEHSRYRIVKVLGRGGMGVVYKAEHRLMERPVALKVINPQLIANPLAVERFLREFKTAARLTHPNIIVAHDADQAGGLHFLVMEYVDGVSLAEYVERKGPLPITVASYFIRQVALGLHHAARQGMVHRDIKPQNLMLTRKGQIKILDFGLARFASEGAVRGGTLSKDSSGDIKQDVALTAVGMIVGTPDYMAPEQATTSRQIDARADIYSLGCTFFYLLTGHAPFSGGSVMGTLLSHAVDLPPSLLQLRNDVPPQLIRLIEQMMAKIPEDRPQTAGEVAQELAPYAAGGLAAVSSFDSGELKSRAPDTFAGDEEAATRVAGPASTMHLAIRGHWRAIWHRSLHALRNSLRTRPRQTIGALAVILLAGTAVLFLVNRPPVEPIDPIARSDDQERLAPAVPAAVEPVKQRAPRVALVLTRTSFSRPDYFAVRDALEHSGSEVTVVSSRVGPIYSDPKLEVDGESREIQAEVAFGDIQPDDFDAVVFIPSSSSEFIHDPEAFSPAEMAWQRQATLRVLNQLRDSNVCLAAIGSAVFLLARFQLLDGQAAVGPEWLIARSEFGAVNWDTSRQIVIGGTEGQFVTADNIRSALPFAEQVHASAQKRVRDSLSP